MKHTLLFLIIFLILTGCTKKETGLQEQGEGKKVDLELIKNEPQEESSQVNERQKNRIISFQYAVYRRKDWKPVYSTLVEIPAYDKWNEIVFKVDEKTVGYDGFGGISAWKGIDILRFQFIVASPGLKTLFYVDDVVLESDARRVINLDFESEPAYIYVAKGSSLEGANTVVTQNNRKCLKMYGLSEDKYNSTGVEIQFDLPVALDLSGGDFRIGLKYFIPSKIE